MSLRRDLYLLLLSYSDKKDHLTVEELAQFLKVEQKVWKYIFIHIYMHINQFKYREKVVWKNFRMEHLGKNYGFFSHYGTWEEIWVSFFV